MTWSKHSRRTEPISRSTNGFCHGDRGAESTSSIPIAFVIAAAAAAVSRISITQNISARVIAGKRFPHLLHCPLLSGVFSQLEVQHTTSSV
jgi:hypothetical protein